MLMLMILMLMLTMLMGSILPDPHKHTCCLTLIRRQLYAEADNVDIPIANRHLRGFPLNRTISIITVSMD